MLRWRAPDRPFLYFPLSFTFLSVNLPDRFSTFPFPVFPFPIYPTFPVPSVVPYIPLSLSIFSFPPNLPRPFLSTSFSSPSRPFFPLLPFSFSCHFPFSFPFPPFPFTFSFPSPPLGAMIFFLPRGGGRISYTLQNWIICCNVRNFFCTLFS